MLSATRASSLRGARVRGPRRTLTRWLPDVHMGTAPAPTSPEVLGCLPGRQEERAVDTEPGQRSVEGDLERAHVAREPGEHEAALDGGEQHPGQVGGLPRGG